MGNSETNYPIRKMIGKRANVLKYERMTHGYRSNSVSIFLLRISILIPKEELSLSTKAKVKKIEWLLYLQK
jgi:hypothetical protein